MLGPMRPQPTKIWRRKFVKVLVVGDSGLGKTTLISALLSKPGEQLQVRPHSSSGALRQRLDGPHTYCICWRPLGTAQPYVQLLCFHVKPSYRYHARHCNACQGGVCSLQICGQSVQDTGRANLFELEKHLESEACVACTGRGGCLQDQLTALTTLYTDISLIPGHSAGVFTCPSRWQA